MSHYQNGYDDYWNAKYNPPTNPIAAIEYMRGYYAAEHDIAIGNY